MIAGRQPIVRRPDTVGKKSGTENGEPRQAPPQSVFHRLPAIGLLLFVKNITNDFQNGLSIERFGHDPVKTHAQ